VRLLVVGRDDEVDCRKLFERRTACPRAEGCAVGTMREGDLEPEVGHDHDGVEREQVMQGLPSELRSNRAHVRCSTRALMNPAATPRIASVSAGLSSSFGARKFNSESTAAPRPPDGRGAALSACTGELASRTIRSCCTPPAPFRTGHCQLTACQCDSSVV